MCLADDWSLLQEVQLLKMQQAVPVSAQSQEPPKPAVLSPPSKPAVLTPAPMLPPASNNTSQVLILATLVCC